MSSRAMTFWPNFSVETTYNGGFRAFSPYTLLVYPMENVKMLFSAVLVGKKNYINCLEHLNCLKIHRYYRCYVVIL